MICFYDYFIISMHNYIYNVYPKIAEVFLIYEIWIVGRLFFLCTFYQFSKNIFKLIIIDIKYLCIKSIDQLIFTMYMITVCESPCENDELRLICWLTAITHVDNYRPAFRMSGNSFELGNNADASILYHLHIVRSLTSDILYKDPRFNVSMEEKNTKYISTEQSIPVQNWRKFNFYLLTNT